MKLQIFSKIKVGYYLPNCEVSFRSGSNNYEKMMISQKHTYKDLFESNVFDFNIGYNFS